MTGLGAFTPGAQHGGGDPIELAVKHLRGCGFDERADQVQALADSYADALETAKRATALAESYRALLAQATPYRDMWALQLQASDAYRRALETIVRACGTLAEAKLAAREALR